MRVRPLQVIDDNQSRSTDRIARTGRSGGTEHTHGVPHKLDSSNR
jgi:hypothetical protein